jgi:prephenate dehydrogenase
VTQLPGPKGSPTTIAVVGLGLIGGSAALRIRQVWPGARVFGVDDTPVLDEAARRGLIDESVPTLAGLPACDVVLLATPVPVLLSLLADWPGAGAHGLISDTGSTKRQVMSAAARVPHFVGGHPVAGHAPGGLEHAAATLFEGRPWVIVAAQAGADSAGDARRLAAFATAFGATPIEMSAEQHDRTMAYVSHVPQLLAVGLMNAAADACGETAATVSGRVFDEMTRVAASPGSLWQGILESNQDYVDEALKAVTRAMPAFGEVVDAQAFVEAFARANRHRLEFDRE